MGTATGVSALAVSIGGTALVVCYIRRKLLSNAFSIKTVPFVELSKASPILTETVDKAGWARSVYVRKIDGGTLTMVHATSSGSTHIIVLSHGKGGSLLDVLDDPVHNLQELCKTLVGLGADLLCYDYSGFGGSTGGRSERAWVQDCATAFSYAEQELQWPRHKIIAMGQSVGTGVVIQYLRRARGYAGLVLFHPYRSILATRSVFLARYVLRFLDVFKSEDAIDQVEGPVLIVHAAQDRVRCCPSAPQALEGPPA